MMGVEVWRTDQAGRCVRPWAHLDELQAERSQGELSEGGEREDGRVDGIADWVIEAGDLQALQAAHQ